MGFFSLPMARLTGPDGRVICVDLQQGMLDSLRRRANRQGLDGRLDPRLCGRDGLGLEDLAGQIDFAVAFAVVHEVPDAPRLFADIHAALKPAGRLLFAEPSWHVHRTAFEQSVVAAETCGFTRVESPAIGRSHAAILEKGSK